MIQYFAQGLISDHITIYDFYYLLSVCKTGQNIDTLTI